MAAENRLLRMDSVDMFFFGCGVAVRGDLHRQCGSDEVGDVDGIDR